MNHESARPIYAEVLPTPILVGPVIPSQIRIVTPPFPGTRGVPPIAPLPTASGFRNRLFLGILSLSSQRLVLKLPRSWLILGCPLLRYYPPSCVKAVRLADSVSAPAITNNISALLMLVV